MNTTPTFAWRELLDGGHAAYIGGASYRIDPCKAFYRVLRDGVEVAGPTCVGAPAGFLLLNAAKLWAEQHAAQQGA